MSKMMNLIDVGVAASIALFLAILVLFAVSIIAWNWHFAVAAVALMPVTWPILSRAMKKLATTSQGTKPAP